MWWVMIFSARQLVEQAGIDQPRHAGARLVGPAEGEPDLVLRRLLARVIGKLRAAHRMHPDRQVVLDHAVEDRAEFRRAERLAGHVGEDLDALGAEARSSRDRSRASAASRLFIGSDAMKVGKRSRMPPAELRQPVIGEARQLRRLRSGGPSNSSGGLASDSTWLVVAELIEQLQPRVEVPQRRAGAGNAVAAGVIGHESPQPLEISRRHEMIEDVDDQLKAPVLCAENLRRSSRHGFQAGSSLTWRDHLLVSEFVSRLA